MYIQYYTAAGAAFPLQYYTIACLFKWAFYNAPSSWYQLIDGQAKMELNLNINGSYVFKACGQKEQRITWSVKTAKYIATYI